MKKSYIIKTTAFANYYNIRWCTPSQLPAAESEGYERITRRDAIDLVINERRRRRENSNFAGYADADILPFDIDDYDLSFNVRCNNRYHSTDGYIWEKWS